MKLQWTHTLSEAEHTWDPHTSPRSSEASITEQRSLYTQKNTCSCILLPRTASFIWLTH